VDPSFRPAQSTTAQPAAIDTGTDASPDPDVGVHPELPAAATWSPWSTSRARWSWGLLATFVATYFVVAVLTSKDFADLAATMILGLPLGFLLGLGVIAAGLVITRIYLVKVEGEG
jgi:uncharacterized membrane protein (DUF485 family)